MIRQLSAAVLLTVSPLALASAMPAEPQRFETRAVRIDGFEGTLKVVIGEAVTYAASGPQSELDRLTVRAEGDTLVVQQAKRSWLDGSAWTFEPSLAVTVTLTVPAGTPFRADDLFGRIEMGDLGAPVDIEAVALEGTIGDVTEAEIDAVGSVTLDVGAIAGRLDLDIAGAARLKVDSAQFLALEVSGAGTVVIDTIAAGLNAEVAGAGDIKVGALNGPLDVRIAGAGDFQIASGKADGFRLQMLGASNFDFDGEAVDPDIQLMGPGEVRIKSYSGSLTTNALGGTIRIGDVTIGN